MVRVPLYGVNSLEARDRVTGADDLLSGDTLDGSFPPKPPKMRWATYRRLRTVDLQE
jgi:hypothetical protein